MRKFKITTSTLVIAVLATLIIGGASRLIPNVLKTIITDAGGTTVDVESNGGLAVNIQDQTSPPLDLYFTQAVGPATTLTAVTAIGDTTFNVVDLGTMATGGYVGVFSGASGENRFYFAEIISVAVGVSPAGTVTVDTPFDFAFDSGDPAQELERDMDVSGSLASPQTFRVAGAGIGSGLEIDITRIMFTMTLATAADDGLFGNLTKLTNGVVFRRVDGDTRNTFNFKDNGELANLAYDVNYTVRSGGQGSFGLRCRYTFAGQDKHGVALRLSSGDSIEVLIQDDLTGLGRFRMLAAGHIVTD